VFALSGFETMIDVPHRAADDEEVLILQEVLRGKRCSSKRSSASVGDSQRASNV